MRSDLKFNSSDLRLDQIVEDPFFIPEVFESRPHKLTSDQTKKKIYLNLLSQFKFSEYPKVWQSENKYFLIDNLESLRAIKEHHKSDLSTEIPCIVLEGGDRGIIKNLSMKLRSISSDESHVSRLITIHTLLFDLNCSLQQIKDYYGVEKSQSAEGRKLQRDCRIVKYRKILNRVLGLCSQPATKPSSLLSDLFVPKPEKASLEYGLALDILKILRDEDSCIDEFDARYEKYIRELQEKYVYEEDEPKPIHKWRKYNKDRVKNIAISVVKGSDRLNFNYKALIGDSGLPDQKWSIKYSEHNHDLIIPQIKTNLSVKNDRNIKQIVDLKYKLESLAYSLDSYIKRIRPTEHGSPLRVKSSDIQPAFDTRGNMPKFEDKSYIEYIRKNKMLHYCNRELLLKSIDLNAYNFGFATYEYDGLSSHAKAFIDFEKWWNESFLPFVNEYYNNRIERHPKYRFYEAIKLFLHQRSLDNSPRYFCDFISEVFKHVFSEVDAESKRKTELAEKFIESDDILRKVHWIDIFKKLDASGMLKEDASKALREGFWPSEDRVTAEAHKLSHAANLIIKEITGSVDSHHNTNPLSPLREKELFNGDD